MNNIEKMQLTLDLAKKAMDLGECPIAAIVFLDDEIVAESHTKEFSEKRLLVHAELNALTEADQKGYSYEDRRKMQLFTNLEPCIMCMGAAMSFFHRQNLLRAGIPTDGGAQMIRGWTPKDDSFPLYDVPEMEGGILRNESKELFRAFSETCASDGMRLFAKSLSLLE